jgi:hypothetical protein
LQTTTREVKDEAGKTAGEVIQNDYYAVNLARKHDVKVGVAANAEARGTEVECYGGGDGERLVEMAFIDEDEDCALLVNRQDEFARAIARGITDYAS